MAVVQTLIGNVKGPAGATGATGAQGPQGDAATISVGSVTSAAYGTPASVTNSGTSGAAVFDFVIPQGKPGEKTTKMGELVLDTITTSTDSFPSPAVDDTGAIAFGKIRKFFADTLSALAAKIDTNKIADNLTTNDPNYVLSAAQGKALNDSLGRLSTQNTYSLTLNTSYTTVQGAETLILYGYIGFIHIGFAASQNIPVGTRITTLPTNIYGGNTYVARENVAYTGRVQAGTGKTMTFNFRANGDITNGLAISSGETYHIDAVILINVT